MRYVIISMGLYNNYLCNCLSFSSSKPDADWIRGRYHSHSFYQFLGKYQRKTLANYWNEYY